jgi:hypothetical protein
MRIHIKWLFEAGFDFLNDMVNIPLICNILKNQNKFVTTQPSNGISRPHTGA